MQFVNIAILCLICLRRTFKMKREEIYMQLFEFSRPTYYKWKREGVPALRLIEENFTDEELIAYLENQKNIPNVELNLNQKFQQLVERIDGLEKKVKELEKGKDQ